jgi:hypothetical protein
MGIKGNKIADQLARECSSHPLIGPEPALGISAKIARGVIRDCTSGNHEHWQSICGQRQAKGFHKKTLCEKSW